MPSKKESSRASMPNCKSLLSDRLLCPDEQIKLFCRILHFPDDKGKTWCYQHQRNRYVHQIQSSLSKLEPPVSKPGRISQLLLPAQSEYTRLCDMHNKLNADFVHQWFKLIALEVGARLEIPRAAGEEYLGTELWENAVYPATRIHTLWLKSKQVEQSFPTLQNGDVPHIRYPSAKRQSDGCEACILARIGASKQTTIALYVVVKSRISLESQAKHPQRLRLLRLIKGWLQVHREYLYKENQDFMDSEFKVYDHWADQLYVKRQELKLLLHKRLREQNPLPGSLLKDKTQKPELPTADDIEASSIDAENDIIDTYAALQYSQCSSSVISTVSTLKILDPQGKRPQSGSSVYTAASMISSVPSLPSSQTPQSSHTPDVYGSANKAYLESRYSIDTVQNNQRVTGGQAAALADLESRSYSQRYSVGKNPYGSVRGGESSTKRPEKAGQSETHGKHGDRHRHRESDRASKTGGSRQDKRLERISICESAATNSTVWPVVATGSRVELRGVEVPRPGKKRVPLPTGPSIEDVDSWKRKSARDDEDGADRRKTQTYSMAVQDLEEVLYEPLEYCGGDDSDSDGDGEWETLAERDERLRRGE